MAVRKGIEERRILRGVSHHKQGIVLDLKQEGCEAKVL